MTEGKTGADCLMETFVNCGVEVCFTNPGTTEIHMVGAMGQVPGLRPILCLFEGVATGAADGYGRMAGKPAMTLLHLGPGMANGIANLHNAQKAHVPLVNVVGDHALYHQRFDAPLSSDLRGYAAPFSGWYRQAPTSDSVAALGAEAVRAAMEPPGRIATLSVPADCAWGPASDVAPPLEIRPRPEVPESTVARVAQALKAARKPALLLSGEAVGAEGLKWAGRVAKAFGALFFRDTFAPRLERGAGRTPIEGLPYFPEMAAEALKGVDLLVLVETRAPVAFFAYPGLPSAFAPPDCQVMTLAHRGENGVTALRALAEATGARADMPVIVLNKPPPPTGLLSPETIGQALAHYLPAEAIVADEMVTAGLFVAAQTEAAEAHDWLAVPGGAIGSALPLAVGAAVACPDRKVLALSGDGSAMYTCQSLWTMAREKLDITVVVFANNGYRILGVEYKRAGLPAGGTARQLFDIGHPVIDWVRLAQSMGVEASAASDAEEFGRQLGRCLSGPGPHLIQANI